VNELTPAEEKRYKEIHAAIKGLPCQTQDQARFRLAAQAMCVLAGFTRGVTRGEMFGLLDPADAKKPQLVKQGNERHWQQDFLRNLVNREIIKREGSGPRTRYLALDHEGVAHLVANQKALQDAVWPKDGRPRDEEELDYEDDDPADEEPPTESSLQMALVERLQTIGEHLHTIGELMERVEGKLDGYDERLGVFEQTLADIMTRFEQDAGSLRSNMQDGTLALLEMLESVREGTASMERVATSVRDDRIQLLKEVALRLTEINDRRRSLSNQMEAEVRKEDAAKALLERLEKRLSVEEQET
jgi:hypothetical protein